MFEGRVFSPTLKCLCYWYTGFWVVLSFGDDCERSLLCEAMICTLGHKAGGARRRRSSRSLLWTAGKAYTPAVVPVSCLPVSCLLLVCFLPVSYLFVCLFSFSFHSTHTLSLHLSLDSSWIPLTLLWRFYLDYDQENRLFLDRNSSKPLFYPYLGTKSGLQSIKSHISWS